MSEPQQSPTVRFVPHLTGPRFFTVPEFDKTADELKLKAHLVKPEEPQPQRRQGAMRYAAYVRISSEEQVGNLSVDAQRRAIEDWVKGQDGKLTQVYIDEAQSGRTTSRPAFQRMRRDARKRKFDALVVHKFDRFARCQQIRTAKAVHHEHYPRYRVYLLRDIIFCADCVANMPEHIDDDSYSKMRPYPNSDGSYLYYRCRAHDFGRICPQKSVRVELVEEQVVSILQTLKPRRIGDSGWLRLWGSC